LQEKYEQQAKDYQVLTDKFNERQANEHQLEIKVEKAQGCIETLEQALKNAEDKIAQLYDKNLALTQEQSLLLAQLKPLPTTTQDKR